MPKSPALRLECVKHIMSLVLPSTKIGRPFTPNAPPTSGAILRLGVHNIDGSLGDQGLELGKVVPGSLCIIHNPAFRMAARF